MPNIYNMILLGERENESVFKKKKMNTLCCFFIAHKCDRANNIVDDNNNNGRFHDRTSRENRVDATIEIYAQQYHKNVIHKMASFHKTMAKTRLSQREIEPYYDQKQKTRRKK